MSQNSTLTTAIQSPPGLDANLTLPGQSTANPAVFEDSMVVRVRVFVDEQNVPAESEIDTDDARSWHWVIYDTTGPESRIPVATIRLVPPPQPPHELLTHPEQGAADNLPPFDWLHEPCIKLTRVAVIPQYRGRGLGRLLVETALGWAKGHAVEIDEASTELAMRLSQNKISQKWTGLVLLHAQVDVESMYQGLGFTTDELLGRWDEEGIDHVGMYRRIEITEEGAI